MFPVEQVSQTFPMPPAWRRPGPRRARGALHLLGIAAPGDHLADDHGHRRARGVLFGAVEGGHGQDIVSRLTRVQLLDGRQAVVHPPLADRREGGVIEGDVVTGAANVIDGREEPAAEEPVAEEPVVEEPAEPAAPSPFDETAEPEAEPEPDHLTGWRPRPAVAPITPGKWPATATASCTGCGTPSRTTASRSPVPHSS